MPLVYTKEEIKAYLAERGFDVTNEEMINQFIHDLKKLVKYEDRGRRRMKLGHDPEETVLDSTGHSATRANIDSGVQPETHESGPQSKNLQPVVHSVGSFTRSTAPLREVQQVSVPTLKKATPESFIRTAALHPIVKSSGSGHAMDRQLSNSRPRTSITNQRGSGSGGFSRPTHSAFPPHWGSQVREESTSELRSGEVSKRNSRTAEVAKLNSGSGGFSRPPQTAFPPQWSQGREESASELRSGEVSKRNSRTAEVYKVNAGSEGTSRQPQAAFPPHWGTQGREESESEIRTGNVSRRNSQSANASKRNSGTAEVSKRNSRTQDPPSRGTEKTSWSAAGYDLDTQDTDELIYILGSLLGECDGEDEEDDSESAVTSKTVRGPSNAIKRDPVALYHYYKGVWDKQKFPGEDRHMQIRWNVRAQTVGNYPCVDGRPVKYLR